MWVLTEKGNNEGLAYCEIEDQRAPYSPGLPSYERGAKEDYREVNRIAVLMACDVYRAFTDSFSDSSLLGRYHSYHSPLSHAPPFESHPVSPPLTLIQFIFGSRSAPKLFFLTKETEYHTACSLYCIRNGASSPSLTQRFHILS